MIAKLTPATPPPTITYLKLLSAMNDDREALLLLLLCALWLFECLDRKEENERSVNVITSEQRYWSGYLNETTGH